MDPGRAFCDERLTLQSYGPEVASARKERTSTRRKLSEEQIIRVLKAAEAGAKVREHRNVNPKKLPASCLRSRTGDREFSRLARSDEADFPHCPCPISGRSSAVAASGRSETPTPSRRGRPRAVECPKDHRARGISGGRLAAEARQGPPTKPLAVSETGSSKSYAHPTRRSSCGHGCIVPLRVLAVDSLRQGPDLRQS